jgi:hypothetical protein
MRGRGDCLRAGRDPGRHQRRIDKAAPHPLFAAARPDELAWQFLHYEGILRCLGAAEIAGFALYAGRRLSLH